jgi:hypothetical protein
MFRRSLSMFAAIGAALAGAAGFAPGAAAAGLPPPKVSIPGFRAFNDGGRSHARGGGGNRAQQRAAIKAKNRARHRRACKGKNHG